MKKLIDSIDTKLDNAYSLVATVRKLTKRQVKAYYKSLADRKAEYEFTGKSGWQYIYDNESTMPVDVYKLARRYKLFSAVVANANNSDGDTPDPVEVASGKYEKLDAKERERFLKRHNLQSTL